MVKNKLYSKITNNLIKIYSMILEFRCKHCHKCCSNIIWFEPENTLIRDYIKNNYLNFIHLKI
jgi:hypothetical protein